MMKSKLPKKLQIKILTILSRNYRISTEYMLEAVMKAKLFDKKDEYKRHYWRSVIQQFMASIRDNDGNRLIFNISANRSKNRCSEYIVVAACNDPNELKAIKHRLHSYVAGLENSISVINARLAATQTLGGIIARIESDNKDE